MDVMVEGVENRSIFDYRSFAAAAVAMRENRSDTTNSVNSDTDPDGGGWMGPEQN